MTQLLRALDGLEDTHLIFTLPNADTDGRILIEMIESFVSTRPHCRAFTSLGQLRYLSCIRHVDAVVGNSSSGLAEVPSFGKATVNIGDRQRGRLRAESVIDCAPDEQSIAAALRQAYSAAFLSRLANVQNPYGEGGASERVVETLRSISLEGILKKKFFDLPAA
jgi:GDP/UDP-N,N'-diacetylbacillosamine 2-epimerase (hydrolysing)